MLDEVNAGLNASEIDDALGMIRQIAERGVTILVIEHLMKVVLSISHRVVVLHHGQLIAEGAPRDVRQRQARDRGLSRREVCGRRMPRRRHDMSASPKLQVSHLQAGYGDVQVLWDIQPRGGGGRARLHRRLERRRQDHADALHFRAARAGSAGDIAVDGTTT